ncbi:MAG: sensor hybrid histidine kinase [Candidatus Saccharibacteria bacterium]|nr:sensor hybrid histidine kinase [Candidatus Saccharibacteria bacterium]
MAKIMLVEDDNNLREIYEARLLAEGYEIVSAKDGEEALALAVKEKPDLIISDVMMPKISGFDMLDILRTTPETKNTKVIMMTALSQAEDKTRADKLGADRYLVKSQVTLEDVAKVAKEVLTGEPAAPAPAAPVVAAPVLVATPPAPEPVATPAMDTPAPTPVTSFDSPAPAEPVQPAPLAEPFAVAPVPTPVTETPVAPAPDPTTSADTSAATTTPAPTIPTTPPVAASATAVPSAPVAPAPGAVDPGLSQTTQSEEASVDEQINQFLNQAAPAADVPTAPAPETVAPVPAPAEMPTEDQTVIAAQNAAKLTDAVNDILQPAPDAAPAPITNPGAPAIPMAAEPTSLAPEPVATPVADTPVQPEPVTPVPAPTETSDQSPTGKKIIQPITDPNKGPDINALLEREERREGLATPPSNTVVNPNGQSVTPTSPTQTGQMPNPSQPGNVVNPGSDPNSISL